MYCENIWCSFWNKFKCTKKDEIHINEDGVCETHNENYVSVKEYYERKEWVNNCKIEGLFLKYIK